MLHYFFLAISFLIVGASVGSFCGVLMETAVKRSFWTGRSQCLSCHEQLRWHEMIPVLSYIFQFGKCRQCRAHIPLWILSIEVMMGLCWMLFGTIFVVQGLSLWVIMTHLLIISMVLMLAMEDIKTFTIPDRLSLPMMAITILCIGFSWWLYTEWLLPGIAYSLLGSIMGMLFYLLQMMVPSLITVLRKKKYMTAIHILFVPLFFPFWLAIKWFFSEKKADELITSVSLMDDLPTWVGGGDVRLGILLGLILGPIYFWWTVGIGYTLWTLFWLISRSVKRQHLDVLPVAPLLFLGFCATWLILLFS